MKHSSRLKNCLVLPTLAEKTVYRQVTKELPNYFATRPLIPIEGARSVNLLDLLRAPATGAPGSLSEQLSLIRKLWRSLLGESLERFLQIAGEILREEEMAIWMQSILMRRAYAGCGRRSGTFTERAQRAAVAFDREPVGSAGFWRSGI